MFKDILSFYRQYRTFILIGVVIFFAVEIVNSVVQHRLKEMPKSSQTSTVLTNNKPAISPVSDVNSPDVESEKTEEEPNSWLMWLPVIFISLAATLIYFFEKWKGAERLFPGYILLRAGIVGNRRSGYLKWQINLSNRKREAITFNEPILVFSSFTKKKKFKINSNDFSRSFPITLTPKTSHSLTIELNQFYHRFPELASYRFVRTEIVASNGKTYRSIWKILAVKLA